MKIELTKNQQKLKDELKEYFYLLNKELLSSGDPQFFEGGGPEFKSIKNYGSRWMDWLKLARIWW